MSDYEFWKDLGSIFDAILHYQKKNVEFNESFINPWIRLGNIFDRDDRNRKAIEGYRNAVGINPQSAQNWSDLGDAHFKAGDYDEAINAYQKAVELDPKAGWPLSNLAYTLATQGRHEDAIPLYAMSIDLFTDNKEKAINWNRLGNSYRKLNDYERAFQAFQKADEFDHDNAGFRDQLDESAEPAAEIAPEAILEQVLVEQTAEVEQLAEVTLVTVITDAVEDAETVGILPNTEMAVEEAPIAVEEVSSIEETPVVVEEPVAAAEEATTAVETPAVVEEPSAIEETPAVVEVESAPAVEEPVAEVIAETVAVEEPVAEVEEAHANWLPEEQVTPHPVEAKDAVVETPEWLTEELINNAQKELAEEIIETAVNTTSTVSDVTMDIVETFTEIVPLAAKPAAEEKAVETEAKAEVQEEAPKVEEPVAVQEPVAEVESAPVAEESNLDSAYEQYLKDTEANIQQLSDRMEDVHPTPEAKVTANGEVRIVMDTRNAHVWNELGNVYLNSGALEDAISAYSKAINLDRQFAWPYSNLAMAYVKKGRLAESILLYQRSIELFTSDKDKAVAWNRLGNVYRRLDDYPNAIAAYQTADELDPDNTTRSLLSHYGLLGNLYAEQKAYAA